MLTNCVFLRYLGMFLYFIISLLLVGCSSDLVPPLGGSYDGGPVLGDGIFVQMAIQPEDNTFVGYINNREVDQGKIEKNQIIFICLKVISKSLKLHYTQRILST